MNLISLPPDLRRAAAELLASASTTIEAVHAVEAGNATEVQHLVAGIHALREILRTAPDRAGQLQFLDHILVLAQETCPAGPVNELLTNFAAMAATFTGEV